MKMPRLISVLVFFLSIGCKSTDYLNKEVVHTPARYSDNRVLYIYNSNSSNEKINKEIKGIIERKNINDFRKLVSVETLQAEYITVVEKIQKEINELTEKIKLNSNDELRKSLSQAYDKLSEAQKTSILNGDPLSIVLRSVGIPEDAGKGLIFDDKTLDIAVLLDITTRADQNPDTLVVWFQRGVKPGQTLNFSNILVYYEPSWDYRYPPTFRIRLVQVVDIQNKEIADILGTISTSVGSIAAVTKDPLVSPLVQTAMTGAKLVLANADNKVLIDYTVQFYSSEFVQKSNDTGITGLYTGSFIVMGKPHNYNPNQYFSNSEKFTSFWDNSLYYKSFSGEVFFDPISVKNPGPILLPVKAPFLSLNVTPAESILPKSVIERSILLNKLLTSFSSGSRITDIKELGANLSKSIEVFTALEKAKRFERISDVKTALNYVTSDAYADEDKLSVLYWLNRKCNKVKYSLKEYIAHIEIAADTGSKFVCPIPKEQK